MLNLSSLTAQEKSG